MRNTNADQIERNFIIQTDLVKSFQMRKRRIDMAMAYAKKCDRCGKLYEEYNTKHNSKNVNGILTANIDFRRNYFSNDLMDFCPECMDSFNRWLKEMKEV